LDEVQGGCRKDTGWRGKIAKWQEVVREEGTR